MHIRHFILMGAFIGAAAFLPNHSFAEDNRAGDHAAQHSDVHSQVLENSEKPKKLEKAVSVPSKNEHKSQGGSKENTGTPQAIPVKPEPPIKGKGRVEKAPPPAVNKRDKARGNGSVNKAAKAKVTENRGRKEIAETQPDKLPVVSKSPDSLTSNPSKSDVKEISTHPSKVHTDSKAATIDSRTTVSITPKPLQNQENKTPEGKNHPGDVEIINNPPQRIQTSGGSSHDPFNTGASATSIIAHWFDWDIGLNLGNIYHSREAQYWYQWMNAPPSPPPKEAPFSYRLLLI